MRNGVFLSTRVEISELYVSYKIYFKSLKVSLNKKFPQSYVFINLYYSRLISFQYNIHWYFRLTFHLSDKSIHFHNLSISVYLWPTYVFDLLIKIVNKYCQT